MSQTVTVELPDELARRARSMAAAANRRLEDAVIDWINQALGDSEIESLSDDELSRRCDSALAVDLLAASGELSASLITTPSDSRHRGPRR